MEKLTDDQARRMYRMIRRYRDKLAVEINNGTLKDSGEFCAVCDLINDVKPAFHQDGPPPGVAERRRVVRH